LQINVTVKEKTHKRKSVIKKRNSVTNDIFKETENKNMPDFAKPKKLRKTIKERWFRTRKTKNLSHTNWSDNQGQKIFDKRSFELFKKTKLASKG
jgi:hypothetical protein